MYCRNCGVLIEGEAKYCMYCGTEIYGTDEANPKSDCSTLIPVRTVYVPKPSEPSLPGRGLGIASMILGIAGLAFCWLVYFIVPYAVTGLIFGLISASKARKVGQKNTMATVGIICSSISFAVSVILTTVIVIKSMFA